MKKKLGKGSLSLLLVILALLWSCNIAIYDNFCLSDCFLGLVNIPAWSNGTSGMHYTVWYSLILLIPAFILGIKHENHLFAVSGKWISGVIGGYLLLSSFMFLSL